MTVRGIGSGFATALALPHVRVFPLIDIGFDGGTQYLCGLDYPVTWSGHTYTAALGLIAIEPVRETARSWEGLRITISGLSPASIALALSEPMQGRTITLRMAALDASNTLQVDANVWSGPMDAPRLRHKSGVVVLTAEHHMATWDRPRVRLYTDAQLQADYPGDLGLQYIAQTESARLYWPLASFWKR